MHVLQDAVAVVGRLHAQVGQVARLPGLRQVLDRQLAFQQRQLQVEAQHHMQVVGHLIRVGADERAPHLVDRPVEGLQRHLAQLVGEGGLQPGVEELQRVAGAPHDIFPHA